MTNPADTRTRNQRLEDEIEAAWQRGDISHADACAALVEDLGEEP